MAADRSLDQTQPNDAIRQALDRLSRLDREKEKLIGRLTEGERRFRRLGRAAWNAQESERRRLACELHDGVGQTLTALKNELELVRRAAAALPSDAAGRLDLALDLAARALADTREMSRLLRPQILDDLGLEPALRWLCRTQAERSGADIDLVCRFEASSPLGPELQTLAFRVVQEALHNAEKYSEAARIDVSLSIEETRIDSALHLVVSDDGRGFDSRAVTEGTGIRGLRDRLALFSGSLEVDSSPGAGTRLRARVPLTGEPTGRTT